MKICNKLCERVELSWPTRAQLCDTDGSGGDLNCDRFHVVFKGHSYLIMTSGNRLSIRRPTVVPASYRDSSQWILMRKFPAFCALRETVSLVHIEFHRAASYPMYEATQLAGRVG